jgi:hypothetical protein
MDDIMVPILFVIVLLLAVGARLGGDAPGPGEPGYDCAPSIQAPVC